MKLRDQKLTIPKPANGRHTAEWFEGRHVLYVAEVARALRISEHQVRNFIEEGKLRAVNIGNGDRKFWRIPVEALREYLEKNSSLSI